MDNSERLNLNESSGLNKNKITIGSATATVQLINETQATANANDTLNISDSKATSACSKNKICISTNKNDETVTFNNSSKHKINSSSDYLKSTKTFDDKNDKDVIVGTEDIPLKNLSKNKKNTPTNTDQVKITLNEDEKKCVENSKNKIEKNELGMANTNNRKKFFEINFSKINRKTLKRPLPCLFAWTLLIGTTGAYFALVVPKLLILLDENYLYWLSIIAAQSIIFLYVLVNFLIATLRDPGRFPKVIISPDDPSFNDDTKSPLYKSVTIKKTQVKIKWCSTCNFYRPPRCSHCSICDACIDQFDHHCPWLNNCVVCLIVALKITPLVSPPVITAITIMGLVILLIIPIGGLLIFHLVLIGKGRTTNEHVTGKYRGMNFFTRNCFLNFMHLFFGSLIPQYKVVRLKKKKIKKRVDLSNSKLGSFQSNNSSCEEKEKDDLKNDNNTSKNVNNSNFSGSESDHSNRGSLSDSNETNQLNKNKTLNLNTNNQVELLDVVLKNKKMLKNNRKTSVTSNSSSSSVSASMLNNKDKKSTQK